MVRTPVTIKATAPKRLLFLHVVSLYMLQLTLTPTREFLLAFGRKFPITMNMPPMRMQEIFPMSTVAETAEVSAAV